ncbi:MAG: electron transport complex subunit RsxD [gamma proteobacterium symbiont of Bathyaustriella thionipta]|nr:electron transport complex subunit RsxD [gamma proteobacterium symbiont of Bathyaustriella thionipta]
MNALLQHSSPHGTPQNNVTRMMLQVLLALVPGIIAMIWYFGWGVLINILLSCSAAVFFEALVLKWRKRPLQPALSDLSAIVTAVLLGIAIPPLLPWWITLIGIAFAIIIVKQLYGGLGYNPFNPAMAAYALLLVSYPIQMTSWLPPEMLTDVHLSFSQSLSAIFSGILPAGLSWDAISMATPLDDMRTQLGQSNMISEIRQSPLWGDYGGRGWEWVANWYFLGGLYLLYKRVISWHIPVSMLASLALFGLIFFSLDPQSHPVPLFHLFSGGAMLGAFFIATDPVTACTTRKGQLIYGACIGALIYIIRSWGGFPDAVAFAVLLMNMAAPTIDYYTRPRTFGHAERERD